MRPTDRQLPLSDGELAAIEAIFTARFADVPDAVCWTDPTLPYCPIVACNPAFERIYGYSLAEVIGHSIHILDVSGFGDVPDDGDRANRKRLVTELRLRGITFGNALHRRKDGCTLPVEYSGRLAYAAGREFIQSTSYPIHTHQPDGPADEVTQRFFRMGFGFFDEGVALVDLEVEECPIVECNEAFAHMNGFTREELLGRTIGDFNPSQDVEAYRRWRTSQHAEHLKALKQIGKLTYKGAYRRKDGSVYSCQVLQTYFSAGEKGYMLVALRSLSDFRKQALELVAQSAPLPQTLEVIARMIECDIPGSHCVIYKLEANRLHVAAGPHLIPEDIVALDDFYRPGTSGPITEPLALRSAVILTEKVREQIGVLPLPITAESYWAYPIVMQDDVLGIIELSFESPSRTPWPAETSVLETAIALAAIAIDHTRHASQLMHQAQHDYLTGLPNRLLLEDRLQHALPMAKRRNSHVGVLFLDLDGFKRINDTLGHAAGDVLLQETGRRLNECVRQSDTVGRLGGDEFMVILTSIQEPDDVDMVACKVLQTLQQPFNIAAHELSVTTSIGIAIYPQDGEDAQTLQRNADAAMYRAKAQGKNQYERYSSEIGERVRERFELKMQLRKALTEREFEVFYQPQIRLSDQRLCGLEALIRWRHPTLGLLLPQSFVPAAEESGVILRIGAWVIDEVCRQMRVWRDRHGLETCVNVNISALQFGNTEFNTMVRESLSTHRLSPECLQLDLAENIVIQDLEDSTRQMEHLRNMGIGITIDDFGTAHSSLSYIKKLPINTIKIGSAFVEDVSTPQGDLAMVRATIQLAHSLDLTVISEGAESWEQIALLRELGCDVVQGYAIAKPMPAAEVIPFLEKMPRK